MSNDLLYSLIREDNLGITPAVLQEVFGVPVKTINNGISLFKKGKTRNWAHLMEGSNKLIVVSTIPKPTIDKYKIPKVPSEAIKVIDAHKQTTKPSDGETLAQLNKELQTFCDEEWPFMVDNYEHLKFKIRPTYAIAETALQFVVNKVNQGISWEQLHQLIKMNCKRNKSRENKLKLLIHPGADAKYFEKKVIRGCQEGFVKILVNGNMGKPSKKRTSEEARELVIAKMTDGRVLKLTKIHEAIKKETSFKISYRTIRRIHEEKEELAIAASKGVADYEINRAPYFKSSGKPTNIGDYAEADGTRYGFISMNKLGEIVFERGYAIIDGHSGLSVGCIGKSENEDLALATFKIFAKRFGFLPREIRHDRASAHTSEKFEKFKELSSKMGVVWRPSKKSTDLSLVERYHSTFITRIGNGKDFFVGEGIKSKRERSRPSPDTIALYRSADNLITQEELHQMYYLNEREFNNDVIIGKKDNTLSSQMKWNRSIPENAVKIDAVKFILLFGERKEPTVQKGIVTFTWDYDGQGPSQEYNYSIYRKELLYKVNFKKIIVRFDRSDMSKAYLFSSDEEFLSTIDPTPSGTKPTFAQTEIGKQNLALHCEQKKELMEGIKEDIKHYKNVLDVFEESKIPKEVLSPYDNKDLIDQADLDYFMQTQAEIDLVTEAKRKKKTADRMPKTKPRLPASLRADAKENAKHYQ